MIIFMMQHVVHSRKGKYFNWHRALLVQLNHVHLSTAAGHHLFARAQFPVHKLAGSVMAKPKPINSIGCGQNYIRVTTGS